MQPQSIAPLVASDINPDLVGQRILVVEDDEVIARLIISGLRQIGCEVVGPVRNASDTWQAVNECLPDLVLMDIGLEGEKDGIDTAAMLRQQFDVPVVFLTGASDTETIVRAKRIGPLGFLAKPVKQALLRNTVETALYREAQERKQRARERWYSSVLSSVSEAVITVAADNCVNYLNPAAERLLGKASQKILSRPLDQVLPLREETSNRLLSASLATIGSVSAQLVPGELWIEYTTTRILDQVNEDAGAVVVLRDITQRREHAREIERLNADLLNQSVRDELTGLYNRRGIMLLAEQLLRAATRDSDSVAVLFIDLDGMKQLNDQYGHDAGDELLCDAANVLRSVMRTSDVIGRLGGDEFVVVAITDQPEVVAARLQGAAIAHNVASGGGYQLSLSIGHVVHRTSRGVAPKDFAELLAQADKAMYVEKQARRARREEGR